MGYQPAINNNTFKSPNTANTRRKYRKQYGCNRKRQYQPAINNNTFKSPNTSNTRNILKAIWMQQEVAIPTHHQQQHLQIPKHGQHKKEILKAIPMLEVAIPTHHQQHKKEPQKGILRLMKRKIPMNHQKKQLT